MADTLQFGLLIHVYHDLLPIGTVSAVRSLAYETVVALSLKLLALFGTVIALY